MNEQLNDKLTQLAIERQAVQDQKDAIAALEAELAETDLHKSIQLGKESLSDLATVEQTTAGNVRELALIIYERDPDKNKTICPDVKIGEYTVVSIDDEPAVFEWALEHKIALKLDIPAIKKQVKKADVVVDGVTTSKEAHAKIARDLSVYLTPDV